MDRVLVAAPPGLPVPRALLASLLQAAGRVRRWPGPHLGDPADVVVLVPPCPASALALLATARRTPGARVLLLLRPDAVPHLGELLVAGARAVGLQDDPPREVERALAAVRAGLRWFSPRLAAHVPRTPVQGARRSRSPGDTPAVAPRWAGGAHPAPTLTAREVQVMVLVAEGFSNQEIGERLFLAVPTVKDVLQRASRKLGASNRTHAAVRACRAGVLDDLP